MRIALLVAPALALMLLAAHFLHAGLLPVAALAVLLVGLLAVPRAWAARTVQAVLALATVEWVVTAYTLVQIRARHDQPYLRLVIILGAVALFTAAAAALFRHPVLRARFGLDHRVARAAPSTD